MIDHLRRFGPRSWVLLLFCLLACAEYALRGWERYRPPTRMVPDERLGWRREPDRVFTNKRGVEVHINSLGYRDRDWAAPAEEALPVSRGGRGGLRIAVLGNSVDAASGVPIEQSWGRLLEHEIEQVDAGVGRDRDVLVMNFAVPGYVLEQLARVWDDEVSLWKPDILIIGVNAATPRPMRFPAILQGGLFTRVLARSSLYLWWCREVLRTPGPYAIEFPETRTPDGRSPRELERSTVSGLEAPNDDDLWRGVCSTMEGIRQDLDSWGGRSIALYIPTIREVALNQPTRFAPRWQSYCERQSIPQIDLFEDFSTFLSPLLEEVEAGPGFRRVWNSNRRSPWPVEFPSSDRNLYFFLDPLHLTATGHARVTTRLLETMRERGMIFH